MFGRDKETEVVNGKTQRDHSVWSHRFVTPVDCQEENKLKARRLVFPQRQLFLAGCCFSKGCSGCLLRSEGHSPLAGVVWATLTLTSFHDHAWLWLAAQTDTTVLASVVSIFPLSLKVLDLNSSDWRWWPTRAPAGAPWWKSKG